MIRRPFLAAVAAVVFATTVAAPVLAQSPPSPLPSIADATRGMERKDGFLPLYWDARANKLWMEIPQPDREMIYLARLTAGVGNNDIGLDRGALGESRLVRFARSGPRVLLVQPNQAFRADTANPDERNDVETSFAQSVLWGFTVAAETDGRILVDATDFALRDAYGVVPTLREVKAGDFRFDLSRSAFYLPNVRAFPRNSEIEVTLTFTSDQPGRLVQDVTPTASALTVRERQSFVALPEPGYVPRRSDPRAGFFTLQYADFAARLGVPLEQRFILRHRLRKKEPKAAVSEAVEPIVYYVERGAPEPIRSALLDGARWWNHAFEAAGYRNAFRVELLPEGADPMDVRYNVIQWVHRSTRGWSLGDSVIDPRTGEIIKGQVTLGSLRDRQDYLIAEGLLSPYPRGDENPPELQRFVLARLRQLAAHEVGHTLGLAHNYIASAHGRASVMDYPAPLVRLTGDGRVDLHDAYTTDVGAWDKIAIAYGYADTAPGTDERSMLDRALADGRRRGYTFLTDRDARPAGSAHPQTHLWDNGTDAADELMRVMLVRRAALNRFGERAIRTGMPLATMEDVLVPLYLYHRYQAEAATKMIGGRWYTYALRGDGQSPLRAVPAADQRRALGAVLATVDPRDLALPKSVLDRLPPRPSTFADQGELFPRYTGLVFDAVSPAVSAANLTFALLFNPERASRLVEQHALNPALPGLDEMLSVTTARVFGLPQRPYERELARAVQRSMVERLIDLASDAPMPQVRAEAVAALRLIAQRPARAGASRAERAHARLIADDVARFMRRPWQPTDRRTPLAAPPGSPIGERDP